LNSEPPPLFEGSLDLRILKSLVTGEMHGLRNLSQNPADHGAFVLKPGSLPPALRWMEEDGWISSFGETPKQPAGNTIGLTKPRRKQQEVEATRWGRISWAIAQALEAP
jgi:PadR family transcriptional regulator PadR